MQEAPIPPLELHQEAWQRTSIILVSGKEKQKDPESRSSLSARQVVDQPGLHKTLS